MPIPNLKNNLLNKDFKLDNFINVSEVEDYIKELPGIKDIIISVEELFSSIKKFADKIMKIVDKVLSMFNIKNLFDSVGLKDLYSKIFDMTNSSMEGSGFTSGQREDVRKSFVSTCLNFNDSLSSEFGMKMPTLQSLSITGVLLAMICNGSKDAFTGLKDLFKSKEIMSDDNLNSLFAKTVTPLMKNKNTNSINMINDIATSDIGESILGSNPNILKTALNYMNDDKTVSKNNSNVFDDVLSSFTTLNDTITNPSDTSIFKTATKFKELANSKNLSTFSQNNIDDPTTVIDDLAISVISLF